MANYPELATTLSEQLSMSLSTVDFYGKKLREAGLLFKTGRGPNAAQMRSKDAAIWLIACCVEHQRNGDFIAEVDAVGQAPLIMAGHTPHSSRELEPQIRGAFNFLRPLGIIDYNNRTALAGLTALFDDVRNGTLDEWRGASEGTIYSDFDQIDRSLTIAIDKNNSTSAITYGSESVRDEERDRSMRIQKIFRVRTPVFRAIADTLGPLDE